MSTKEVIGWCTKYVLLPLTPFLVGALLRYFYQGSFSLSIFDPLELSFSMAILSLLIAINASKLRDKDLADSLSYLYFIAMFFFLIVFVCASLFNIQINDLIMSSMEDLKNNPQQSDIISSNISQNLQQIEKFDSRISAIRIFTIIFSCIVIPSAIICKIKFKLER